VDDGGAMVLADSEAQQVLRDAVGLHPMPPERERLQWLAQMRDGRVVHQYGPDGVQARFSELPKGEVATVWLQASLPLEDAPVQYVTVLAAVLHVPEGAVAQLLYRAALDVTMAGDVITEQKPGPRQLLAGWRFHDGSRRECWVLVEPDASAHVGLDPQRPWQD